MVVEGVVVSFLGFLILREVAAGAARLFVAGIVADCAKEERER